ncbi:hypothetical protein BSKO_04398 [Bryopsis sp. KO-2023]|nr:hypothetical protein BSKO_04398 [Bryopsis sp. KO-2023]
MLCADTDGDTTQETRQRPVDFEVPNRASGRLTWAYEVGLKLTRKKERCKMLEKLKATEQDRIEVLWTELEVKRQKLDVSQTLVDELSQQLDKEKEAIALLEKVVTSCDRAVPDQVKEFLGMVRGQDTDECSSPLEGPDDSNTKEDGKDNSQEGETGRDAEHETVEVQHVFERRGRGRTPKSATVAASPSQKRGRGRPRKQPAKEEPEESAEPVEVQPALPKKRGRGRPKKTGFRGAAASTKKEEVQPPAKRQRGRPRKIQ